MRPFLALALAFGLQACAQAPQPAATPILASGSLQGHLQAGVYQDRNDWFTVATPLAPDDPHYAQMSISETYPQHVSYVVFSPSASPGEYYKAFVEDFYASNHQVPSMDKVADEAMRVFGSDISRQRLEPVRLVEERPWRTATTEGLLRLYTERTPMGTLTQDPQWMGEDYTAYILMYVTAQKGKVAILWSEFPTQCAGCAALVPGPAATGDDPIDKALAADGRSKPFMDSFHYHAQ